MDALKNLLDKATERCSPSNGEGLAKKLGVTRSAVSKWRTGSPIAEKHLTALIEVAHADPRVAVTVLQEQATTSQERSVWGALARQLGAAAALAIVGLFVALPGQAQASTDDSLTAAPVMHYAKYCARFTQGSARRLGRLYLSDVITPPFDRVPAVSRASSQISDLGQRAERLRAKYLN